MKQNPLNIILADDVTLIKKFYLISGNEITLIEKVKEKIINVFQKSEKAYLTYIESISNFVDSDSLFENKKIYVVKNHKGIDEVSLNRIRMSSGVFIFVHENSQKIKKIKTIFSNDKDAYMVDCYELDRNEKSRILNEFLKISKISIPQDLYWFLVEKLDNRYGFLKDSLNKILELNQKDINQNNIKKILTITDGGREKLFFLLLKKNKEIIETYREKVANSNDVNDLYYNCKFYCQLIIDSKNLDEYKKKIPIYLFKEKSFLIDLYKKYNPNKKKLLLNLLSSTEKTLRKESGLSLISGLRFFLNIKKITVS